MTTHQLNNHTILAVPVPDGKIYWNKFNYVAADVRYSIIPQSNGNVIVNFNTGKELIYNEVLPPGEYKIIGKPKEVTEEQWRDCDTATESGLSFCKAEGIDDNSVLILKL